MLLEPFEPLAVRVPENVSVVVGDATVGDVGEGDVVLFPPHPAVVSASVNGIEKSHARLPMGDQG